MRQTTKDNIFGLGIFAIGLSLLSVALILHEVILPYLLILLLIVLSGICFNFILDKIQTWKEKRSRD